MIFPFPYKQECEEVETSRLQFQDAFIIDSNNAFELALVLKKKQLSAPLLKKAIVERIEEKKNELSKQMNAESICLIGHSQIDNWEVSEIVGLKVHNCGIRGISSAEYNEYILNNSLLNCNSNYYIVMHGTNDIVTEMTDDEIVESIRITFNYIKSRHDNAKIYFLSCAHVNGRLDRDNKRIDSLNVRLKSAFEKDVNYIDVSVLDNEFNELDASNTLDGLHFSNHGYKVLKQLVEKKLLNNE